MKKILLLFILVSFQASAQKLPGYTIFSKEGKSTNFGKMIKSLNAADIILFGEQHNDAITHWLQLQLVKAIDEKHAIQLGAEMFEADDQVLMNEYLSDVIRESHFTTEGKMWKNYSTDYKPLVEYAKGNNIDFVATNVPRRYASLVNRKGLEALEELSEEAKSWIAPLPIQVNLELPGYKWMIETMGAHAGGDPANIARSQAVKDATMAHFILKNLRPSEKFIHFHGTFHSNNFEGIYHYLTTANTEIKAMTIATVSQADISKLEEDNKMLADFIIVTPMDSPKSY